MADAKTDSLPSRRDFLKTAGVAAMGALLAACGPKPAPVSGETPAPGPLPEPEIPSPQSEFIVFGEPGKDIWQVSLKPGDGLLQAVETIAPLEKWSGFALTWITADRSRAVKFTGPQGLGQRALLVWDKMMQAASQYGLEDLARFNPRTAAPNDTVIFGNTSVVGKNFDELLKQNQLASISEYLTINLSSDAKNQTWTLSPNLFKHLSPGDSDYSPGLKEWQAVPLKSFTSQGFDGNWQ